MKILWHSAAPWEGTGYGTQTALWTQEMARQGHDVAISAYHGINGDKVTWQGIPVYPAPYAPQAIPETLLGHMKDFRPDLTILLCDVWRGMPSAMFKGWKTAAWMPADTARHLAIGDVSFLVDKTVRPIAMSRHGETMLEHGGFDPLYVPHGLDAGLFRPLEPLERERARRTLFGLEPGQYAVGMVTSTIDPYRKALPEQIQGFERFHGKHSNAVLFIHAMKRYEGGADLDQLVNLGTGLRYPTVRLSDQYAMQADTYTDQEMATFYSCMDVVLNATRGEGFGLPAIHAQACGTPVILSDNTTGPELVGPGWLVKGQDFWDWTHASWRFTPFIKSVADCLERAYVNRAGPFKRDAARLFAEGYSVESVWPLWEKALQELVS